MSDERGVIDGIQHLAGPLDLTLSAQLGYQKSLSRVPASGTEKLFASLVMHYEARAMSIYGPHSAANLLGPLRSYISKLMTWAKKRATGYGIAAALILGAVLFIGIAAGRRRRSTVSLDRAELWRLDRVQRNWRLLCRSRPDCASCRTNLV